MARAIYEVYAKVVDANGAYNTLTGYPKVFNSNSYGGDVQKTYMRAQGGFADAKGDMCKVDTRQIQTVMLFDVYGNLLDRWSYGDFPEPVEPEPEE